jgi:hypothetical protein
LSEGFDKFGLHMDLDVDDEHGPLKSRPAQGVKSFPNPA